MDIVINAIGFTGAWFLFAGPIYQAAIELQEEGAELIRLRGMGSDFKPNHVSVWWWIIPPLKIYLELRARRDYEDKWWRALESGDRTHLVDFRHKATGWQIVALGGLCIAIKETYELLEFFHLGAVPLVLLVIFMTLLSILHLIYCIMSGEKIKRLKID